MNRKGAATPSIYDLRLLIVGLIPHVVREKKLLLNSRVKGQLQLPYGEF